MGKKNHKSKVVHEVDDEKVDPSTTKNVDKKQKIGVNADRTKKILLITLIPIQILLFIFVLSWGYKNQQIDPQLQEKIQGTSLEQLIGPQVIDLENNEGDPRLSWFDPGATLMYRGFVNGLSDGTLSLVGDDQNAYDIPIGEEYSIVCMKESRSACPCTDQCTLEHVAGSISVSIHNYYESFDLPDGTTDNQIVSSRIFIE